MSELGNWEKNEEKRKDGVEGNEVEALKVLLIEAFGELGLMEN